MRIEYLKIYGKILLFIIFIVAVVIGATYFFKEEYTNEQFETIKTDMLLIQSKTKIVAEQVNMKKKKAKYVGKEIKEMKDDADIQQLQDMKIINIDSKKNKYYVLDNEALESLGLENVKIEDGYYIVEYNKNAIIYSKGIEDDEGNRVYKLSDMKK